MYNKGYEEYIQSVLGYNPSNDIYSTYNSNQDRYTSDYSHLYPDIYNKLDPIISKVCSMNTKPVNDATIEEMIDAILANVDLDEYMETTREEVKLRNGDVRNPNAKDQNESRQKRPNKLLRALLRILILNKLLNFSKNDSIYPENRSALNMSNVYSNRIGNKYPFF